MARKHWTQAQVDAKLAEIQASIPKEYFVFEDIDFTPTLKRIAEELAAGEPTKDITAKARVLLDSGMLSHTLPRIKPECRDKVDEYLTNRLNHAVRTGELPNPRNTPYMRRLTALRNAKK